MPGHMAIEHGRCLNNSYQSLHCNVCSQACPTASISITHDVAIAAGTCNDCGLCTAVCPSAALVNENFLPNTFKELLESQASSIFLACRQTDEKALWPCLGFLDSRLLLSLVYSGPGGNREVVLACGDCRSCKPGVAEYLNVLFEETSALLTLAGKQPLRWRQDGEKITVLEKKVSRRGFLASIVKEALHIAREAVYTGLLESMPRFAWYQHYVGTINIKEKIRITNFYNITIGDTCTACGVCLSACPEKAITAEDLGHSLDFYHQPERCTGCRVCEVTCPSRAITLKSAERLSQNHVALRNLPRCKHCHEIFQPVNNQEFCLTCLLSGQTSATTKEAI